VILVDTSAWIQVFRSPPRLTVESFPGGLDGVVTCLPVVQEVLQGFRDEGAYRTARAGMWSLPMVEAPLRQDCVDEAINLYRAARRAGLTVRSGVDCLIAACALRNGLTVVHFDRDYAALAKISPLLERSIGKPLN
jgi:predicted nucleic acid-binding protein